MRKPSCVCGQCRKCKHREYMREYLRRNPEQAEKARQRKREWDKVPKNKARSKASATAHVRAMPRYKRRAHDLVAKAVKRGELIKPTRCQVCKAHTRIEAHHEDYSKPLEVQWLCRGCHNRKHYGKAAT